MLSLFLTGIQVASVLVLPACLWALYVNRKTSRDRRFLMHCVFDETNWSYYLALYDQVTYEQHLAARFFLRDPFKLYARELQEIL